MLTERLARALDSERRTLGEIRERLDRYGEDYPESLEFLRDIDRRIAALKADLADYCGSLSPSLPLHDDRFPLRRIAEAVK